MWVHSSLSFLPMIPPSLRRLLLERSMHLILGIENMSRISFSNSSVMPFFLRESVLTQGSIWMPSISSLIPALEKRRPLKPERSIFSSDMCSLVRGILFFFSPFLGGSPLGNLSLSIASLNYTTVLLSFITSFSFFVSSSEMSESSPRRVPTVWGRAIFLPVSLSYLLYKNWMIFCCSSNCEAKVVMNIFFKFKY